MIKPLLLLSFLPLIYCFIRVIPGIRTSDDITIVYNEITLKMMSRANNYHISCLLMYFSIKKYSRISSGPSSKINVPAAKYSFSCLRFSEVLRSFIPAVSPTPIILNQNNVSRHPSTENASIALLT